MATAGSTKLIDLSTPIKNNAMEPQSSRIDYVQHRRGAFLLGLEAILSKRSKIKTLKGFLLYLLGVNRLTPKDFPQGMGLAWENLRTMTHRGTHLDAPWHFGTTSEGRPAKTIDQIPLEWCFGDGVLLDMTHKGAGEHIEVADIEAELRRIDTSLKPLDIVLIRTGADKRWDKDDYLEAYPGMSREAVSWILDHGVKIIGVDSYSVDRPSGHMLRDYLKDRDQRHLWPAHFLGREREYCHIEKLANLERIPHPRGFKVCCFPVLIERASAGWCRVVAVVE
jgi:kynurenine formamidase